MSKNKQSNEYGFAHLGLIIIIVLVVAVIGLVGFRVSETRSDRRAGQSETAETQEFDENTDSDKLEELAEESLPEEQIKPSPEMEDEQSDAADEIEQPVSAEPRQIYFVKGGENTEGDSVTVSHTMTEAHSGTCTFTFSLNGTVRVQKTVKISGSKTCMVVIPKSEFPKSAEYSEVTKFVSDDGSVFAETQPYGITVI